MTDLDKLARETEQEIAGILNNESTPFVGVDKKIRVVILTALQAAVKEKDGITFQQEEFMTEIDIGLFGWLVDFIRRVSSCGKEDWQLRNFKSEAEAISRELDNNFDLCERCGIEVGQKMDGQAVYIAENRNCLDCGKGIEK